MCPTCHSVEHDWMELTGRGTVYSYSVLHHPQNPAFDYPVIAVIVETTEGVRIVSTLVDVSPEQVAIGMPVSVRFEPTLHDMAVPVFGPEEAP